MNRKQRRAMEKRAMMQAGVIDTNSSRLYNLSEIEHIKKVERERAVQDAIVLMFSIPVKVLYEKFGFGTRKRLPEFAEALANEYGEFENGDMSIEQYQKMVEDLVGIHFERRK